MARPTSSTEPPQCTTRGGNATARRPHIITLMADDLGFGDAGYMGSSVVRTPHLDALAREAVHLTHFRAPVWCAPSRASFLTGRHGWEIGLAAAHGWTVLGSDSVLLSELLRTAGYHTAIVGKFHFNPRLRETHPSGGPFGCGFDQQYGFVGGMSDYFVHHKSWSRDGTRLRERGYATALLGAEAVRIVQTHAARRPGRPLFLWVSLNAPHTPMQAPEEAVARFPAAWPRQTRTYAAMVELMDRAFGAVVAALREARMLRRSLIAFMSDNGGPMIPPACNGALRGGKGTPYEGGVRAPAFVHWPDCLGRARRRTSAPAHMVDWLATFALAAVGGGREARARLLQRLLRKAPHSTSLWPALSGARQPAAAARRQLVLQVSASAAGVLRGRWKLLIASPRCLAVPDALPHNATLPDFHADRFLLWNVHGKNHTPRAAAAAAAAATRAGAPARRLVLLHNGTNAGRLHAARAVGAALQLFDVHADPHERHDLLGRDGSRRVELAGALLGHYLSAVRVARRAVERATEQGRIERLPRGYEMTVWFCRQVGMAWEERRWAGVAADMCAERSPAERATIGLAPSPGGGAPPAPRIGKKRLARSAKLPSR